jgi:Sec-independent protein translocase protein TatA
MAVGLWQLAVVALVILLLWAASRLPEAGAGTRRADPRRADDRKES